MKTVTNFNTQHVPISMNTRFNSLLRWLLPGLVAGIVFLVVAMVLGAFTTTAWAMPDGIAQVVGISAPIRYGFAPLPVLAGIAIHLAVSVGIGIIFTAGAHWLRLRGWVMVVAAVIYALVEPALAIWVVLHSLLPTATFLFFITALPVWLSLLGHCIYGLVLGLFLVFGPFTATWIFPRGAQRVVSQQ